VGSSIAARRARVAGLCGVMTAMTWTAIAAAQDTPDSSARASGAAVPAPAGNAAMADTTLRYVATMPLEEVVAATLRNSPSMAQATGAVRTGESGERVAYGQFLPSLTFNSAAFQTNARSLTLVAPTGGGPGPLVAYPAQAYSAGLAASYDVFTGGRKAADVAASRATTRSADASLVQQRYAVALAAKTAFYGVRRADDLVRVSVARVTTAERAEQYADARLRRGAATRADVLLARLNLTTARQQLIAARDTLTTTAYALGRLVGLDGAVGARGGDSLPPVALALGDSAIIDLAVHGGPAVRAADEFSRATDASVRSAQTQYVPDIRLTGGYNWANNSAAFGAARPGWVVEIGTSYPLFNGFLREDDVTRASATARTARVTAADTRRFARAEAERLLASLRFASENVAEAEEAVRVSSEDLRVVGVRYQNGVSTFLDLSTAQLNQAQADVALVAARYDYLIARASLEALVGREL
jgi:outer membrane protein